VGAVRDVTAPRTRNPTWRASPFFASPISAVPAPTRRCRWAPRNLLTDRAPGVVVELSDGRRIKRGGVLREEDGRLYQQATTVEGFERAPIAVRRQHVETFWNLSDEERKEFFFDYLHSDYRSIVRPEQIVAQEEKVAQAERGLAAAREELLGVSGLPSEAPPVPETLGAVDWWKGKVLDPHLRKARNKDRRARSHFSSSSMCTSSARRWARRRSSCSTTSSSRWTACTASARWIT
jgi:hypothetical protein